MLYHYTTIQTLALILESEAIRFRKLSKTNDPDEGTADHAQLKEFVYSSSWTSQERENIGLWKMYAGMDGVRIGLPEEMFPVHQPRSLHQPHSLHSIKHRTFENAATIPSVNLVVNDPENSYLESGSHKLRDFYGPDEIKYTQSVSEARAELRDEYYTTAGVGIFKLDDWDLEKEVRFRIAFAQSFTLAQEPPFYLMDDFVDVPLKEGILQEIEVTVGPINDVANELIANALLEVKGIDKRANRSRIRYVGT
ncbi:hypothetical protein PsAD13_02680 [Pseudovibrio sp. Ad13]|uniref:hypothetical protein n=1 Tax=Pseudovibrio sp. Ad13 TaxID=989396 RepID=UPI0007AE7051|nr:hypothetical protein [Pseudovibrio sp. Ad13]KZK83629.1 hypothetical protein PsAD13_02680 [Pseudovibrio sp. Ad13]